MDALANWRWPVVFLCAVLFSPSLAFSAQAYAAEAGLQSQWKLISDRNGIQVYMRHDDDARLKTFRGVTRWKMPDEYTQAAVLNDYQNMPKWLHFVDDVSEFRREGPLKRYMRFGTHLPWPLADREAVLQIDVLQNITPETEEVSVELTNRPELLPPNPEYVRFPEMWGRFKFHRLPENGMEVTYELVLDPGGYIPAWLANLLLRDAPYFTLERLRRIIRNAEYQDKFYDYLELRGPGRPSGMPAPRTYIYGNPPAEPLENMTLEQTNPKAAPAPEVGGVGATE